MVHIESFRINDREKAAVAFSIRQRVFVDEQHVDREEEYDSHEEESVHYLLLEGIQPAGTARRRVTKNGVKLERFAILPEFRNKGFGAQLVKHVLNDVLPLNLPIYLHAQVRAVNVYKRAGFVAEGEVFYEANIPHYKMTYQPEITL